MQWRTDARLAGIRIAGDVGGSLASIIIVALLAAALTLACDSPLQRWGGRKIHIELRSTEGLRNGDAVYFSGIRIGRTGSARVVRGVARILVYLDRKHRDALVASTVFLLRADERRPGRLCLVGRTLRAGDFALAASGDTYKGARSEAELILLLGLESAREIWRELQDSPSIPDPR